MSRIGMHDVTELLGCLLIVVPVTILVILLEFRHQLHLPVYNTAYNVY